MRAIDDAARLLNARIALMLPSDPSATALAANDTSTRRQSIIQTLVVVLVSACLLNIILIAIPGYYSHDELDWLNLIGRGFHGWDLFLDDYQHSPFFRPLGTAIISTALRLPLQPFGSHAALVFLQALNCCLLYLLVRCFRPDRAFAAAILFAVMPGTAYAAGWIAAFFDLQFTFFALCSLIAGLLFWRGGHWSWLALSIIAFAGGLLCKEPAATIPLAGLVLAIVDRARATRRRVIILGGVAVCVALTYAAFRLPALIHVGQSGGGYGFGSIELIVKNIMAYLAFPFVPSMDDIAGFNARAWKANVIALLAQAALLALLWIRYGRSAPVLYLIAFFLPLLPVLIISKHETQYTYATSIAVSVALALVWKRSPIFAIPTAAIALILILHAMTIQRTMYETGVCQTRALDSLRSALPVAIRSGPPVVYAPDNTRWWIMARALYQNTFRIDDKYVSVAIAYQPAGTTMQFLPDCRVVVAGGS
jgi:hypothetical protein